MRYNMLYYLDRLLIGNTGDKPMLDKPIQEAMTKEIMTVESHENLLETVKKMANANIGAVIVTENSQPIGIFTERDLLKRVVAKNILAEQKSVKDVMTAKLITASPQTTIREVVQKMYTMAMRHMVIKEGEQVVGIFSLRDLLRRLLVG